MIIECDHCHAKYQYDDERFERRPSKKIRCAKCQQVFEIHNPAFVAQPAAAPNPADSTVSARTNIQERWAAAKSDPGVPEGTDEQKVTNTEIGLPPGKRIALAIIDGPDAGSVFRIDKPRVVIGRSSADVILNDNECSRAHAAVEIHTDTALLEDLGSRNGTFFSDSKIDSPVEIWNQSEFRVGSSTLMLIVTEDA